MNEQKLNAQLIAKYANVVATTQDIDEHLKKSKYSKEIAALGRDEKWFCLLKVY